jgi:anti-anti-sigma factor
MMELTIQSDDGNVVRVQLKGPVVQSKLDPTAEPLGDLLGAGGYARNVVLDMQGAEFVDSSGVSWMLRCHKRFREKGGRLVLYGIPPLVMNVLKVLRMNLVFDLAGSEKEAVETAQGKAAPRQ